MPGDDRFPGRGDLTVFHDGAGDTLLHEMVHHAQSKARLDDGHGRFFRNIAADVGYRLTPSDERAAAYEREHPPIGDVACRRWH